MKFLKLFILVSFVFISSLFVNNIFAEDTLLSDNEEEITIVDVDINRPQEMKLVKGVTILGAKIISQEGGFFNLSFSLVNKEGIQNNIKYGVRLAKEVENGINIIDEKVYEENLTLYEGQSINKDISYQAPSITSGDYVLYVTVKNNTGFTFGSSFLGKVSLISEKNGISVSSENCYLIVSSLKDKKFSLIQGTDIKEDENIILNCKIENSSSEDKITTPEYQTHLRNIYGEIVSHNGGDSNPIEIKALEKKDISLILPKALYPQAYDVKVYFKDGENYSNSVVAHYVLIGESGTLQKITLDKDYYKEGENANVSFLWSPRADSFPGSRNGPLNTNASSFLSLNMVDGNNKNCSEEINKELFTNYVNPLTDISVPIIKNCKNPVVNLILKDKDGNVLDQKNFSVETKSVKSFNNLYYFIVIIVLLIAGFVFFLLRKKRENNHLINSVFLFLFTLGIIFGLSYRDANADSFIFGDTGGYFVDVPYNLDYGSSFDGGDSISITFGESTFQACNNALTEFVLTADGVSVFNVKHNAGDPHPTLVKTVYLTAPSEPGNYSIAVTGTFTTNFEGGTSITKTSTGYINYAVNGDGECSSVLDVCIKGDRQNLSDDSMNFKWKCNGYGNGINDDCSAPRPFADGVCNTAVNRGCSSGYPIQPEDLDTEWRWVCSGTGGGENSPICIKAKEDGPVCGSSPHSCEKGNVGNKDDATLLYRWTCSVPGYTNAQCDLWKIYSQCGTEPLTCKIGDPLLESDENTHTSWSCDCSNSEDCNTTSSTCYWQKPLNAKCAEYTKNECDVGYWDSSDQDPEDYSWTCISPTVGESAECSINTSVDMYGDIDTKKCIIPDGISGCPVSLSYCVFNPKHEKVNVFVNNNLWTSSDNMCGYVDFESVPLNDPKTVTVFNDSDRVAVGVAWSECGNGSYYNYYQGSCMPNVPGGWSDWSSCIYGSYYNNGIKTGYFQRRQCNKPSPTSYEGYCTLTSGALGLDEIKSCIPGDIGPNISGPKVFNVGTLQKFNISAPSSSYRSVNYNIDWDGNKTMEPKPNGGDEYYPSNSSGVNPSVIQEITKYWDNAGSYKFNIQAKNYENPDERTQWTEWGVSVKDSKVTIEASKTYLLATDPLTITWSATNVDHCVGNFPIIEKSRTQNCSKENNLITDINNPSVCTGYDISGSYHLDESFSDKRYKISCPNINNTKTATAEVWVKRGSPPSSPYVDLFASPVEIDKGESSVLYWGTVNTVQDSYVCKITDDLGNLIAGSNNYQSDLLNSSTIKNSGYNNSTGVFYENHGGEVTVSPISSRKYTLNCSPGLTDDATVIVGGAVLDPHCKNRIEDEDEEGVDCGGKDCKPCPPVIPPRPPHCTNGVYDSDFGEDGLDCGGICPPCGITNIKKPPIFIET